MDWFVVVVCMFYFEYVLTYSSPCLLYIVVYLQLTSGMLQIIYVWFALSNWSFSWRNSYYCCCDLLVPLFVVFQSWADLVSLSRLFFILLTMTPSHLVAKCGNIHGGNRAHILDSIAILNGVRSSWDLKPGRPPNCWWYIPAHQQFFARWQASPWRLQFSLISVNGSVLNLYPGLFLWKH